MDRAERTNAVVATVFTTGKCLKTLPFPRPVGRVSGQTTVEFALICLPFFIILFAIIDFFRNLLLRKLGSELPARGMPFRHGGSIIQAKNSSGSPIYETNSGGLSCPRRSRIRKGAKPRAMNASGIGSSAIASCKTFRSRTLSSPALPRCPGATHHHDE